MRRSTAVLVICLAPLAAACSGTADNGSNGDASAGAGTTAGTTSGTTAGARTAPAGSLTNQYDVRYCEVLTITVADAGTTAEVWGTQGLNDCPQEQFAAIDTAAVAAELGTTLALPNGPRYWVLDSIVANQLAGSGEIRDFGGIEMRSIAVVDLGTGIPDRRPYVGTSVERDTEFRFDAGREIYELTAPGGTTYVMQSYSLEIDPTLRPEALATLGDRLALPDGWTYRARVLDEPLVVEDVDGVATVLQDELRNSYQLASRA